MQALKREFCELARRSGWSQAEIARRLDYTRGGINGIVTGRAVPSRALVQHFRLVLAAERSELAEVSSTSYRTASPAVPVFLREVVEELRQIHSVAPKKFAELCRAVAECHSEVVAEGKGGTRAATSGRRKASSGVSSKRPSEGERVLGEIVEKGLDS